MPGADGPRAEGARPDEGAEQQRGEGPTGSAAAAMLRIRDLRKTFGGTAALKGLDLEVAVNEIHGLVGHNGSGKSTLVKTLDGFQNADPDSGATAWLDGDEIDLTRSAGQSHPRMRVVHQDPALVYDLNTIDNLALHTGFARTRLGRIKWAEQERETNELLRRLGIELDIHRPLTHATPVERMLVGIAAAMQGWVDGRALLILDEPSAVLPPRQVERLFEVLLELRERGASILYVTHRLDELFQICDRVTVFREGERVATDAIADLDRDRVIGLMLGDESSVDAAPPETAATQAPSALEVRGLRGLHVRDADFEVREGEFLGLAGLPGSGSEELPYALAGVLDYPVSGEFRLAGSGGAAGDAAWQRLGRRGVPDTALVPADRGREGVIGEFSVLENLTLMSMPRLSGRGWLKRRAETDVTDRYMHELDVKAAGRDAAISTLSGGNQQKVVLGRCLAADPKLLLLCEPTAGVDIGTRRAIYDTLRSQDGLTLIVASSDTDDLLALCTRVLVFDGGRPVRELAGDAITERSLVLAMKGIVDAV